ncbi:hypothetical protein [Pseudosulfitobacter pseudonitzschiae]|uniref:hypothetical protein n=1 Tax=Pseudosulfitobacter pseudonitzschiae TaxID=1402135 RepID=UPI003B37B265
MFNFFKYKPKSTMTSEADFDVLGSKTLFKTDMSASEVIKIFLKWTYGEGNMSRRTLGRMIKLDSMSFNAPLGDMILAQKGPLSEVTAKHMIDWLKELGLIKVDRKMENIRITGKGEQIRQYYVLKLGMRGTLYDRMDRFKAA